MKSNNQTISSGFTIIEVLISSALLVLLGAGFVGLQYIYTKNQTIAWQSFESVQDANRIMSSIARELRVARESENVYYPLALAEDNSIIFYSDTDFDGKAEKVRYTLNGTQLTKGIIKPVGEPATYPPESEKARVLSNNIRNSGVTLFYYYNNDWPEDSVNNPLIPANRISQTRMVKSVLRLNTRTDADSDYVIESNILIRTLKGI